MRANIHIERVGLEGQGVGYDAEKNIYFVMGAFPGDEVEVEFASDSRRYRDAQLVKVNKPSVHRVAPPCEYFRKCGGCDWLDWEYAEQLKAKESIVRHLLEKNQMPAEIVHPILGADKILGYRNRIQLRAAHGRMGFFARQSHDIVDIQKCAIADPKLNEALPEWREKLSGESEPTKLELAVDEQGEVGSWRNLPHGAGGFGQVHFEQNQKLQQVVAAQIKRCGAKRVLELYCGNGNLTFPGLGETESWLGYDTSDPALEAAKKVAPPHVDFRWGIVSPSLPDRLPADWKSNYDVLLLDPPRAGILDLRPWVHEKLQYIVYVSCNPLQFGKEVSRLRKTFRLREVQPIDMFPQTRHIEFVATLSRLC